MRFCTLFKLRLDKGCFTSVPSNLVRCHTGMYVKHDQADQYVYHNHTDMLSKRDSRMLAATKKRRMLTIFVTRRRKFKGLNNIGKSWSALSSPQRGVSEHPVCGWSSARTICIGKIMWASYRLWMMRTSTWIHGMLMNSQTNKHHLLFIQMKWWSISSFNTERTLF